VTRFRKGRQEQAREGDLVSLIPARLGVPVHPKPPPPAVVALRKSRVPEIAASWQIHSTDAAWWEAMAAARGADEGRLSSLAGQMAGVGEQLGLALAAATEVALWEWFTGLPNSLRTRRLVELRSRLVPTNEMSMRAMAEAESLFVLGAGHGLVNVAAYALAMRSDLRALLSKRFGGEFKPFSEQRNDWLSMNEGTASKLKEIAESSRIAEISDLVTPVQRLGQDPRWKTLLDRRGEDFHRWRLQSHGVSGVPKTTLWDHEAGKRRLLIGGRRYVDAEGLAKKTAEIASGAMFALAEAMEELDRQWPHASGPLGGPVFEANDDGKFTYRWKVSDSQSDSQADGLPWTSRDEDGLNPSADRNRWTTTDDHGRLAEDS
jgi:hypothetical protein